MSISRRRVISLSVSRRRVISLSISRKEGESFLCQSPKGESFLCQSPEESFVFSISARGIVSFQSLQGELCLCQSHPTSSHTLKIPNTASCVILVFLVINAVTRMMMQVAPALQHMYIPCVQPSGGCGSSLPAHCSTLPPWTAVVPLECRGTVIEEGQRQKKRQRSSLLFVGKNLFNSLPR